MAASVVSEEQVALEKSDDSNTIPIDKKDEGLQHVSAILKKLDDLEERDKKEDEEVQNILSHLAYIRKNTKSAKQQSSGGLQDEGTGDMHAPSVIKEDSFRQLLQDLGSQPAPQGRIALLEGVLSTCLLSCHQFAMILNSLRLPAEKIKAADIVRGKLVDPERARAVLVTALTNDVVSVCTEIITITSGGRLPF
eukprot:m.50941 g.50941  ORF g.50941 m.50941 type:complete len:194 (+) comp10694_c0_seq1:3300-3881(+)